MAKQAVFGAHPLIPSYGPTVPDRATAPIPRWLPNAISAFRVVLVPIWLAVAEQVRAASIAGSPRPGTWLVLILVVLGFSDVLDGWLARRYDLTSRFGATLDAAADKLAQVAFVTYFAWRGAPAFPPLPIWFWGLIIGRDVVLAIGYLVLRRRHGTVDTEHEVHGKVASVLLFLVVLGVSAGAPALAVTIAMGLTTLAVVLSTLGYVRAGFRALDGQPRNESS